MRLEAMNETFNERYIKTIYEIIKILLSEGEAKASSMKKIVLKYLFPINNTLLTNDKPSSEVIGMKSSYIFYNLNLFR